MQKIYTFAIKCRRDFPHLSKLPVQARCDQEILGLNAVSMWTKTQAAWWVQPKLGAVAQNG